MDEQEELRALTPKQLWGQFWYNTHRADECWGKVQAEARLRADEAWDEIVRRGERLTFSFRNQREEMR